MRQQVVSHVLLVENGLITWNLADKSLGNLAPICFVVFDDFGGARVIDTG